MGKSLIVLKAQNTHTVFVQCRKWLKFKGFLGEIALVLKVHVTKLTVPLVEVLNIML